MSDKIVCRSFFKEYDIQKKKMTAQLPDLRKNEFFKNYYYYQVDAISAWIDYLQTHKTGNGITILPTGSGKTYVSSGQIKIFAGDLQARVVMVSHTKKIVQQDYIKASELWPDGKKSFGINSAGLGRREFDKQVLFTGIQSVYKSAKEIGTVNFLIPDECHKINMIDSIQYKRFIEDLYELNPGMRVGGLTATPFRPNMGLIWGPSKEQLFDDVVYSANVKELIAGRYIARPVIPKIEDKRAIINTEGVEIVETKSDREFNQQQMGERVNIPDKIMRQTKIILANTNQDETIASFAFNIKHAEQIAQSYIDQGEKSVDLIHSDIKGNDEKIIEKYKSGKLRVLVSVNMFVEGFDAPNIRVIDDRKPTASPGRYGQMGGRGFRICKEINKYSFKYFCFSGNIGMHGPLDQIEETLNEDGGRMPMKECKNPDCGRKVHARLKVCPYCGYEFPVREKLDFDKTLLHIDTSSLISEPKWFSVIKLHCAPSKHRPTILAHYYSSEGKKFSAEIAYDEEGKKWLHDHLGEKIPFDITNFFNGGYRSKIKQPVKIFVDEAGSASKILKYEFKA